MPETKTETPNDDQKHFYLVDGSGFIFRAFHALPPMAREDGTPTNAVFGFTNMLIKLLEGLRADYFAVIFDTSRKTFRSEIFSQYKANRPPPPEELVPQFDLIREAVTAFNVACIEMPGYEADDLIASYTKAACNTGAKVTIVSSDKDLMQLVGPNVTMYDPMKNRSIGTPEVFEKFGVTPNQVVDVQALAGDSVDNVPGVPGIGVKTAAQLITEFGDLNNLLLRAEEIRQPKRRESLITNAEMARISQRLALLKNNIELPQPLENLATRRPDPAMVMGFLKTQGFKRLTARFEAEFPNATETSPPISNGDADTLKRYQLLQEKEALENWIQEAKKTGIVAVDTETTSLNATQAELVGLSLATKSGNACYIPLRHSIPVSSMLLNDEPTRLKQIPFDDAIDLLKPFLEDSSILKVGHNIKYDALVLLQECNGEINLKPVDDTMCLSYVLEGGMHGHGLDELSQLHLGNTNIKFEEICGKGKSQIPFSEVPIEKALNYAAEDADMTFRLHGLLKKELPKTGMATVYETLERPLIPVLTMMENYGIKVDPNILREMSTDFEHRLDEQAQEIYKLTGFEFNIGSPKQLGEILFDRMGLPGGKKTKTGAYATGADVLESLAANGHNLPERVLDWRQMSKLKSTYTDSLVENINPKTGRIHTSYSMTGANTGRLSSNDPNLQNIPIRTEEGRKIRTAFVPKNAHTFLSVDYSQIELRIVAHMADIDSLKSAFHEGIDIHSQTASEVFNIPLNKMTSTIRRSAKAINFGIIYGISSFGLARQLRCSQGEAKDYIDAYLKRYPGIRTYMESTKTEARQKGYVQTLFGRKIHLTSIKDNNPARRAFSERAAINAPIQGTAADVIKRSMIRIPKALSKANLNARMLLTVHDELLFEVPDVELEETSKLVKEVMECASMPVVPFSVPLIAEVGSGESWAAAH